MIVLQNTQSSTNRHESGPETRIQQPYVAVVAIFKIALVVIF